MILLSSTAEVHISTAGGTATYSRRSAEKRKDKGKGIMTDEEPKKKSKKELEQERLSYAEALRLEEQMNEEQRAQIARDAEIARQWEEEEKKKAMDEAKTTKEIDWNDPSVIRYHSLKMKPKSIAQARRNMIKYLKNQGNFKINDFKGMSYNEIRPIFEKLWDFNQKFVPMDADKGSKKQKSPEKERSTEKIVEEEAGTQEERKEAVNEPAAKRKKSIPRKTTRKRQKEKKKKKKTPLGSSTEKEEPRHFLDIVPREEAPHRHESVINKCPLFVLEDNCVDRDFHVLSSLQKLVKERYSTTAPEGFDLMLWGDLHTLFEPDKVYHPSSYSNIITGMRLFDNLTIKDPTCVLHIMLKFHLSTFIMGDSYNLVLLVVLGAYLSIFVTSYEFINILGTNSSPSSFPRNFLFGTASSSYQFEGGYLADGKGLSNWDIFSHRTGNIVDGSNGDIAVDHYHLYLEDLELMEYMGINTYRFSISWARILPKGRFGNVNIAGIKHYNKIINALIEKGWKEEYSLSRIQPFVTLTHYDIPQELEDRYGGWLSPQIQQDFAYYASICFKYYGDRVKYWVTLNEPNVVAVRGYRSGIYPPARCSSSFGNCTSGDSESEPYIAAHNMILSHAAAVNIYRTKYQRNQNGSIGIVMNAVWYEPISNSTQDRLAAQRALSFFLNWFLDPIIFGNYPEEMKDILGSLLPEFSNDSLGKLKNGLDFIGINHYTSFYAKDCLHSTCEQGGPGVSMTEGYFLRTAYKNDVPIGESTAVDWLNVYPEGMEKIVTYLKHRYNNTPIYVKFAGFGVNNAPDASIENFLNDDKRVEYLKSYLDALVSAIRKGADVRGYIAWSLLDNFEWLSGYTIRFGLYHVDYITLERTPKSSAKWYKQLISNFTRVEAVNF
ncbi:beta-glucosidase 46-like protein isoform X1 [Tanacetum coccineum]